ncbi:MAG: hypothetical protein CMH25_05680 [Micavibrio sp.]|nr:hypothetical protein [Micavibrio sp.]|tara:strand:- start:179919 stop:180356 length:438 start_codon:yes stop_codon:yes gene_type:complete
MAKLDPLIRVRKHTVEEKQKFLATLLAKEEELLKKKADALSKIETEASIAEEHPQDFGLQKSFSQFKDSMTKQIARFDDELEKLALRIEVAQESMREAFADLKKVEIVDRSRKEAQAKEQAKKENDVLDEIGLQMHRREQDKKDK